MAIENLISVEFTQEELQKIDELLTQLETAIGSKFINLTPEQRQEYSRLGAKTEDWVGKVSNYISQYPDTVLPHIDKAEFSKDFTVRQALLPRLRRLNAITARVDDTAMILGNDIYTTALTYYKGVKTFASTNAPNAQTIYTDLKQQFPSRISTKKKEEGDKA